MSRVRRRASGSATVETALLAAALLVALLAPPLPVGVQVARGLRLLLGRIVAALGSPLP